MERQHLREEERENESQAYKAIRDPKSGRDD
jgi:hypothetical protein